MQIRTSSQIDKVRKLLEDFLKLEAASGLLLMVAAVLALAVANSPLAGHYAAFLNLRVDLKIGSFEIAKPLLQWVNDGLMAIFFLLVGMELKREVDRRTPLEPADRASLPAFAASEACWRRRSSICA